MDPTAFLEKVRKAERILLEKIKEAENQQQEGEERERKLRDRIQSLEVELRKARDQADAAGRFSEITTIRNLEDRVLQLEREKERALIDAQDAQAAFQSKSAKTQEMREQLFELERQKKEAQEFIRAVSSKIEEIRNSSKSVAEIAERAINRTKEIESMFHQHTTVGDALKNSHGQLIEKLRSSQEQVARLQLEIHMRDARVQSQAEQIQSLETKLTASFSDLSSLREQDTRNSEKLRDAAELAAKQKSEIEDLRNLVSRLSLALETSGNDFAKASEQVSNLSGTVTRERQEHSRKVLILESEIRDLQARLETQPRVPDDPAVRMLNFQLSEARAKELSLLSELSLMRQRSLEQSRQLIRQQDESRKEINESRKEINESRKEINESRKEINESRKLNEQLKRQLEDSQRQIKELHSDQQRERNNHKSPPEPAKPTIQVPEPVKHTKPKASKKSKSVHFVPPNTESAASATSSAKKKKKNNEGTKKIEERIMMRPFQLDFT